MAHEGVGGQRGGPHVICQPAASAGRVRSWEVIVGGGGETRSANTQKAKRADNRRGQEKHTLSPPSRSVSPLVTSLLHHTLTHTHTEYLTLHPSSSSSSSAVIDLWSSRQSMGLRGDQARLHTSSVNRRSTRALKPTASIFL